MTVLQLNERLKVELLPKGVAPIELATCIHAESQMLVTFKEHKFRLSTFLNFRNGTNPTHKVHISIARDTPAYNDMMLSGKCHHLPFNVFPELTQDEIDLLLHAGFDAMPPLVTDHFKIIGKGVHVVETNMVQREIQRRK